MGIRILLADDHKITREGLLNLLNNQPHMTVIAEAENGREAVELVRKLAPDVVIMDVTMPNLNGIDSTRKIMKNSQNTKVIALSMYSDKRFVQGMMQAGAAGYMPKDCAFDELVNAIRAVVAGHTYLSPEIAGIVVEDYLQQLENKGSSKHTALTIREREVLQLVAEGMSTKKIATILNVSVKTVETHRRQTMIKLGVSSVAELTKYAIKEGLTSLEG